ncbi:MAG: glycosyltransferase [Candidatus Methanomethylicaceae archaeon]
MRVLHLPANIASQTSITVRALRDIGIDARGLVLNSSPIQGNEGIETFEIGSRRRHPIHGVRQTLSWWYAVESAIRWADVVHWHSSGRALPKDLDLRYIALLNKARIVEFWGSDIRIPEIAVRDNPYLAKLLSDPNNDYHISYKSSREVQERFARYGFECLIPGPELVAYVQRDLFPSLFRTEARLILSEFEPKYPDPTLCKPVVVHTPSRLMAKGTPSVLRAIEQLKAQYDFEFKIIHGVPHDEALAMVRDCDIMLDQFVSGSFGVAALEAMALGKPVVCYIKPSLIPQLPSDCPIVNANQDNLVEVLGSLLEDGQRRHELGREGRAYVEKYHDAHQIARQLVTVYQELIEKNQRDRHGRRQVY